MKILSILLLSLPLFAMDKEEVQNIVNESVIGSLESMASMLDGALTTLAIILSLFTLLGIISFFRKKQIKKELQEDLERSIDKHFYEKSKDIQDEMQMRMIKHIKSNIKTSQKLSQREEFLRNIIFIDLNKMLATELNGSSRSEAFHSFATRFLVIANLTSGDLNKTKKALRKLTIDSKKIFRLPSVKNYIAHIKDNDMSGEYLECIEKYEMAQVAV